MRAGNYGFGYLVKVGFFLPFTFYLLLLPLLALRAQAPVDDFCLIYFKAMTRVSVKARGMALGTANVFGMTAGAANEVVVIIADPILVAGCGIGGLDTPEDTFFG